MAEALAVQPQLIHIALDEQDVVYTPDWAARDMVAFFRPSGRVLEPCRGNGAITKYLPGCDWCEIAEGRDFFSYLDRVDWIIGNPPYRMFAKWVRHSFNLADDIVYLVPCDKPFISYGFLKTLQAWGGIKHMRVYGSGSRLGFPIGFAIGAVHFQKGYKGPMGMSFYG